MELACDEILYLALCRGVDVGQTTDLGIDRGDGVSGAIGDELLSLANDKGEGKD